MEAPAHKRAVLLLVLAACLGGAATLANAASAGTFVVQSCTREVNYDSSAFADRKSSRRMLVKRACNPYGPGLRGLITANRVARRRAQKGDHATVVLSAARGTVLTRLAWSRKFRRPNCDWTVEVYAVRAGSPRKFLLRVPARHYCKQTTAAEAAGLPRF